MPVTHTIDGYRLSISWLAGSQAPGLKPASIFLYEGAAYRGGITFLSEGTPAQDAWLEPGVNNIWLSFSWRDFPLILEILRTYGEFKLTYNSPKDANFSIPSVQLAGSP